MKYLAYITVFLMTIPNCRADVPKSIVKRYRQIVELIKNNKANELAEMVEYPLRRQNPLPDIANKREFVSYYKFLFDESFMKKMKLYNDSDIFEHHGGYGLVGGPFHGDIWINDSGKITGIECQSKLEEELRNKLTKDIQSKVYPGIRSWKENVIVCKSAKLLIRIDETDKGLRYVAWSKSHSMSEKPDLILYNGIQEAQGTMGGWTWTFKNGDWTYVIDDVEMCETDDKCGLFLRLFFKDDVKSTVKLKETK